MRYHYGTEKTGERAVTRYVKNPPGTVTGPVCTALGGVFTGIFGLAIHCDVCCSECCSKCRTLLWRAYYFVRYYSSDELCRRLCGRRVSLLSEGFDGSEDIRS